MATVNEGVTKHQSPVATEIESRPGIICRGEEGVAYHINGLANSAFEWKVEGGTSLVNMVIQFMLTGMCQQAFTRFGWSRLQRMPVWEIPLD